jgi:hypothetical protein
MPNMCGCKRIGKAIQHSPAHKADEISDGRQTRSNEAAQGGKKVGDQPLSSAVAADVRK